MRPNASEERGSGHQGIAAADDTTREEEAPPGLHFYYDGTGFVIEYPMLVDSESGENGSLHKLAAVAGLGLDLTMFGMMLCGGVLGALHSVSQVSTIAESAVRHAAFFAAF